MPRPVGPANDGGGVPVVLSAPGAVLGKEILLDFSHVAGLRAIHLASGWPEVRALPLVPILVLGGLEVLDIPDQNHHRFRLQRLLGVR